MRPPTKFPKTVIRSKSGVNVNIYHTPELFRIKATIKGRAIRRGASTFEKAEAIAREMVRDIDKGFDPATTISSEDRVNYKLAMDKLAGSGASLLEAVEYFMKHCAVENKTHIATIASECLESLANAGRSSTHVDRLYSHFSEFADRFPGPISNVTTRALENYLMEFPVAVTRAARRRSLCYLWKYARLHGALPYGLSTAAERTAAVSVTPRDPETFKCDTLEQWLSAARTHIPAALPLLAIGSFCGLRTSEIQRLRWSDINLSSGLIRLGSAQTKTRRRRIVTIPDNAVEWLLLCKDDPSEYVLKPGASNLLRDLRTADPNLTPLPHNGMRHTAATMMLARGDNPILVASSLGNSVDVLESSYKGLATQQEALYYFNIRP